MSWYLRSENRSQVDQYPLTYPHRIGTRLALATTLVRARAAVTISLFFVVVIIVITIIIVVMYNTGRLMF